MVKGYTKAVDLWSLGCVTTALLIGTTPFTIADSAQLRRQTTTLIMEIAARGNLDGLKGTSEWQSLGSRPKDFVLKLLVLDEKSRMTAKEALSHKWFTHPSVKQEYDAVYRRAIRNWQPQVTIGEIVEKLKNSTSTFVVGTEDWSGVWGANSDNSLRETRGLRTLNQSNRLTFRFIAA
jgi:pheromone a factor receptor